MTSIPKEIQDYADAIFLQASQASGKQYRERLQASRQELAARNLVRSGMEVSEMSRLYTEHIGRLIEARLNGYQDAFHQMGETPSEEQFQEIWTEIKRVYETAVVQGNNQVEEFVRTRDLPGKSDVANGAGHRHDEILNRWKVWRAQAQIFRSRKHAAPPAQDLPVDSLTSLYTRGALDAYLAHSQAPLLNRQ